MPKYSTQRLVYGDSGIAMGPGPEKVWRLRGGGVIKGEWENKQTAKREAKETVKGMLGNSELVIETKSGSVRERVRFESDDVPDIGTAEDILDM